MENIFVQRNGVPVNDNALINNSRLNQREIDKKPSKDRMKI